MMQKKNQFYFKKNFYLFIQTSPTIEHESNDNLNNQDTTDHPLELTVKGLQRSTPDVQNLVVC